MDRPLSGQSCAHVELACSKLTVDVSLPPKETPRNGFVKSQCVNERLKWWFPFELPFKTMVNSAFKQDHALIPAERFAPCAKEAAQVAGRFANRIAKGRRFRPAAVGGGLL